MRDIENHHYNPTAITFAGKICLVQNSKEKQDTCKVVSLPKYLLTTIVILSYVHKFFAIPPSRR